jgi:hypothetical protein
MLIEVLGQYRVELSAMQLIHNGGWAAYAAIRTLAPDAQMQADLLPYQRVVDEAVFESEAAAIAGARGVAMAVLRSSHQER